MRHCPLQSTSTYSMLTKHQVKKKTLKKHRLVTRSTVCKFWICFVTCRPILFLFSMKLFFQYKRRSAQFKPSYFNTHRKYNTIIFDKKLFPFPNRHKMCFDIIFTAICSDGGNILCIFLFSSLLVSFYFDVIVHGFCASYCKGFWNLIIKLKLDKAIYFISNHMKKQKIPTWKPNAVFPITSLVYCAPVSFSETSLLFVAHLSM